MKDWAGKGAIGRGGRCALHQRIRQELRTKLLDYDFTHFITLASNHQPLGYLRMRALLKEWDARVNREINGPKWGKRPDERLVWFAFPEKMDVNPHWHMIVQVDQDIESSTRAERTERLFEIGHMHWLSLVRQGSFDCQGVESAGVIQYIAKMSAEETHFNKFVVFREFMNI
ncbi:hypothetical protein [Phaeobacter gallaeciensis]|uniref:Uncharacterized protein n=1 Tax=Phaeobacter gallaeciensis TaxID=60890 RepID=A0AAC9Z7X4_9RHOB|nr:hypothetical protein [Phaeobacter gallaeciensis]AHD08230.1 hypothetical protein Gal_00437 [Phaeobacter gallaeciensis DSM 26640]ATE91496.1 hypothetical protein PhaeoP11_00434 [Phaeobacter gallaeciensis]ATE95772.1 hypothetical protein PhaeoP73_00435 [Phaeobacter gallaeciensis]ATF00112.1 hypothetical protein PhaeoP75_00435 [Phaeobacter gallaeciensis]ATF04544.1 hypothetical protein PhaeoP63_00435 [Phaeobacter gallaeciensis]